MCGQGRVATKSQSLYQQHPDFCSVLGRMMGNASLSGCTVAFGSFWAGVWCGANEVGGRRGGRAGRRCL